MKEPIVVGTLREQRAKAIERSSTPYEKAMAAIQFTAVEEDKIYKSLARAVKVNKDIQPIMRELLPGHYQYSKTEPLNESEVIAALLRIITHLAAQH